MNLKPNCPKCGASSNRVRRGNSLSIGWLGLEILAVVVIIVSIMYGGYLFVIALLVAFAILYFDIKRPRLYECVSCSHQFYFPAQTEEQQIE